MASVAPNGTPVPRAVLKISKDVDRRVAEYNTRHRPTEETPPAASEPAPVLTPPEPAPPAPAPPVDPLQDATHWRNKFQSLNGLIEARGREVATLREQLRTREAELQAQIDTLRASASPPAIDITGYFTPEQIERFGEDQCRIMVSAAQKAAGETVAKQVEQHVKPLVQARQDDAARAVEDAKARFHAELDQLLPANWRDIDTQQPWLAWLAQLDPGTGLPRGDILRHHAGCYDAQQSARMMLAYLDAQKPPVVLAPPAPPVTPSGSGAGGAGNLPAPPAPAGGPPSKADIQDFYKRAALGKVTDAQRVQFEARMRLLHAT